MNNLKTFAIYAGSHDHHKPSYTSGDWQILEFKDENAAIVWAWEMCNDIACNYDQETEVCETCAGTGCDDEGDPCDDCDGNGYFDTDDWSEHVDKNTSMYIEEYDPKVHFAIPSERPEYLKYKRELTLRRAERELDQSERELDAAQKALEKALQKQGHALATYHIIKTAMEKENETTNE